MGGSKNYLKPDQMAEHIDRCFKFKGAKVEVPEKGKNVIKFYN